MSRLVREAEETRQQLESFSFACPLAQRFLKTERGLGQLCYLMLRAHHPTITPEEAFTVAMEMGAEEMGRVVENGQGSVPNGLAPAAGVPAAGSPSTGMK